MVTIAIRSASFVPVFMAAAVLCFTLSRAAAAERNETRTWRDTSGRFSVEAKLLKTSATHVQLQTTDGRKIAVPIDRLSDADRKYLASLASPAEPEDLNDLFDFSTDTYVDGARRNADGSWPHVGPIPNRTIDESKVTYFVSLDGDDANDGRTRETAFRTMQHAADVVEPGETVLVIRGVYRKGFHLAKRGRPDAWITFLAERGVVIKGSDVRRDWKRESGDLTIHSIARPELLASYQRPDRKLVERTEQVFVEGRLLAHVPQHESLRPRDVFYVDDNAKKLYVCLRNGHDPNEFQTEVSARTWAIAIGGPPNANIWGKESVGVENAASHIRINGFAVRNIANFAGMAAIQLRGMCDHILIENCDVQWANHHGFGVGSMVHFSRSENKWLRHLCHDVIVRNCTASNNGVQGIGGGGPSNVRFEYDLLDNNNYKGASSAESGGIKTGFDGTNIILRGNVVRNNHNQGLWIDSGLEGCLIEDNLVFGSTYVGIMNEVTPLPPRKGTGFYWHWEKPDVWRRLSVDEIRQWAPVGTIIRRNVAVSTRLPVGCGILIGASCNTQAYHNVMYGNAGYGMDFGGGGSRVDSNGLSGNRVFKNLFVSNRRHVGYASDDLSSRIFDNPVVSNLYARHWSEEPFLIDRKSAGFEKWRQIHGNGRDVITKEKVFRDPDRFDFTLRDATLGARIGFEPQEMRLDWSEFLVPPVKG